MDRQEGVNYNNLTERILALKQGDTASFHSLAIECFRLQYELNPVYQEFCNALSVKVDLIRHIQEIPFLPIGIFKSRKVVTETGASDDPQLFTSSGTTSTGTSLHYVNDLSLYEKSFHSCFKLFYGNPEDMLIFALLPSYAERGGSSLVYMAQKLIERSKNPLGGFYGVGQKLENAIHEAKEKNKKVLLLGVSYALLDLAEKDIPLNENFIVMETGGMKGRREELLKAELHAILKNKLRVKHIHSEYGMTELLSQAYAKKDGLFESPPWMQVLVRDMNDPFAYLAPGRTGGINVIDLANINSCCFISTQDLGRMHSDGRFELMGRFDNSDIRGCNLLVNG